MKFEHFAINVPDAPTHSRWYVEHLGFQIVRNLTAAPFTHFLADETGRVIVELYSNPAAIYPEYAAQHHLVFHFAVFSTDAAADVARLESAGAKLSHIDELADGSRLAMMRDPWGVALQVCQRAKPFAGF
ncbi:VOC family protein [Oleiharenicola lentus]|uniref:VOC family protein n=1 Tax=Oleiharenicola lentus TaxID=2508720 RepID=UPI003F668BA0